MKKITVGIPKSLLYHKYKYLWHTFFSELGVNILYSPDTNIDIIELGKAKINDEACLSMKIHMGHIAYLENKCDYTLVPRIEHLKKGEEMCTNFCVLYDLVNNLFNNKILHYNIDILKYDTEELAFQNMGIFLGFDKTTSLKAYFRAKAKEEFMHKKMINENILKLDTKNTKILLVGHAYNVFDELIGKPIIKYLEKLNITILYAEYNNKPDNTSKEISKTLYWTYNKELLNGVIQYQSDIDGIILLSTFPCGPDSLVNEIIIRSVKKPIINIIIDELNSDTGIETRLESFVDILNELKKVKCENN